MSKILLIDDEEKLRNLISRIVGLEGEGFEVAQASSIAEARKKINDEELDVVICDVKLPDGNGVEFIEEMKKKNPFMEVILFTAFGNISDSVKSIKSGAFDYLTKGDDNNRVVPVLYRAIEKVKMSRRLANLEDKTFKKYAFESLKGSSESLGLSIDLAKKVAPLDTSVLLLGETGTGKEVFAHAIHFASKRSKAPFVAVNCSAFNSELLESELFGYKPGAFTGAVGEKKGLVEEAESGTLFLDEIGEMALELQAKLLRLLESGEYMKVGDTKTRKVNIRIIAATNRIMEHEIEQGRFRMDLYFRLSAFQILLPPLRDRVKDIPELAEMFANNFAIKIGKREVFLSKEFIDFLLIYNWKGNIRELKNVMERCVILSESPELSLDDLPNEITVYAAQNGKDTSIFSLANMERVHIKKVLEMCKGKKTETAKLLEIGIATLYRKLEDYGINALGKGG